MPRLCGRRRLHRRRAVNRRRIWRADCEARDETTQGQRGRCSPLFTAARGVNRHVETQDLLDQFGAKAQAGCEGVAERRAERRAERSRDVSEIEAKAQCAANCDDVTDGALNGVSSQRWAVKQVGADRDARLRGEEGLSTDRSEKCAEGPSFLA